MKLTFTATDIQADEGRRLIKAQTEHQVNR